MSLSLFESFKAFIANRGRPITFPKRFRKAPKVEDLTNVVEPVEEDIVEQAEEAYVEEERSSEESNQHNRLHSLEDFNLIRVLGRGGYGKVVLAESRATKELYALKVMKKTTIMENDCLDWTQAEKRVFESARMHPYLVGLHACFQTITRLFFVMDFVRGGDFTTLMSMRQRLPENQARFYAAEISLALNFLHGNGIIYRDLKLDNVLLDHEGHVKLADFGLCKDGMREGDRTRSFCGTPAYLAPEIINGDKYNFSVDWWALGVLLFEMLCGRSPFVYASSAVDSDARTNGLLYDEILNETVRIPMVLSLRATSVVQGFLCKDPAERLGCRVDNCERAFYDVRRHKFFKSIDWDQLQQRKMLPPYKPRLTSDMDLSYFATEFTEENIQFTPDQPEHIAQIKQEEFEGFEDMNYDLLVLDDCV